jgi:hypothetical protein
MWSRLERCVLLLALAAALLLVPVAGIAGTGSTQVFIADTFSKGGVPLNGKNNQTYRLLFSPDSPFAAGKVSGILLLQSPAPSYQWQAFVSVRKRGCFALAGLESYATSGSIEAALKKVQPLSGNWLPNAPGDFDRIIQERKDVFGRLKIAEGDSQGLPRTALDQASLAKVVLPNCESPQPIQPDRLAEMVDSSPPPPEGPRKGATEEQVAAAPAERHTADDVAAVSTPETSGAAQPADKPRGATDAATATATATAAAEQPQDVGNKPQAAETAGSARQTLTTALTAESTNTVGIQRQPPATTAAILPIHSNSALDALRQRLTDTEKRLQRLAKQSNDLWSELQDKLGAIAESKDREPLFAWVTKTKPTLIDFPRATPAATAVGNGGDSDQRKLQQQLADATDQIRQIKTASERNWQELSAKVQAIKNDRDRRNFAAWIRDTKLKAPEAFGPVAKRGEAPNSAFDSLWHLYAIIAILLLLLLISLASLVFLWQLKRTQDQIPHRLASDPTFKRTLQESVAPDQIRRDLEAKFKPMQDAASKWLGHFLDKRSELFDEPMKLALGEMAEWSTYQPVRVPPAKQQHTGTADKLAHRGPARGNGRAANETGDEPKALSKLAGELVKTIEDRKKKLEVALGAANQTGAQPELTPASRRGSLVEEAAWIVKGQEIALPLANAFRDLTQAQAELLQRSHSEMKQWDEAIQGLETSNGNLHQQLERAQTWSNRYRSFALGRLMETGFLGAADESPNDETLAKAMERFDNDIEHFPEHLDYAWRLIALRSHLSEDRVKTLPYYGTAGLAELREKLEIRKGDWQSLFHGEEQKIAEALVGQWNGILRHLFRSRLLLQAYWPERTDPDLAFRLERAHAAVEVVLHKHAIHPHPAQLLRPLAEVERPPKIIADDSRPLPPALADSPELNDAMNRLQYEQNTKVVLDVAYWGVDCKVSVPEETTRTLLITRSVRGGTSQSS